MEQFLYRGLIPIGHTLLQLLSRSAEASAPHQMSHQCYVFVRHIPSPSLTRISQLNRFNQGYFSPSDSRWQTWEPVASYQLAWIQTVPLPDGGECHHNIPLILFLFRRQRCLITAQHSVLLSGCSSSM